MTEDNAPETRVLLTHEATEKFSKYLNKLNEALVDLRMVNPYSITKEYEEILAQELQTAASTEQITDTTLDEVLGNYGSPEELAEKYLQDNPDEQLEEQPPEEPDEETVEGGSDDDQGTTSDETIQEEDIDENEVLKRIIPETPNPMLVTYAYLGISLFLLGYSIFSYEADLSGTIRQTSGPAHGFVLLFIGYEIFSLLKRSKIIPYNHYLRFRTGFTSLILISILSNVAYFFDTGINFIDFYNFTLIYISYFVVIYLNDLLINIKDEIHVHSWWRIFSPSNVVLLVGLLIGIGTLGFAKDSASASKNLGFDILISISLILCLVSIVIEYIRHKEVVSTKLLFVLFTPVLLIRLYTYTIGDRIIFGNVEKIYNFSLFFLIGYGLCLVLINNAKIKNAIVQAVVLEP